MSRQRDPQLVCIAAAALRAGAGGARGWLLLWIAVFTAAFTVVFIGGCSWEPVRAPARAEVSVPPLDAATPGMDAASLTALRAARTAHSMVGVPYRWGGSTPDGFDCSGLVQYAYAAHGVAVPRTAAQLLEATQPVALADARAGDLVFFRSSAKGGHVGILLDRQRFVHAPSSGKRVAVGHLSRPWYRERLLQTGRIDTRPDAGVATPGALDERGRTVVGTP